MIHDPAAARFIERAKADADAALVRMVDEAGQRAERMLRWMDANGVDRIVVDLPLFGRVTLVRRPVTATQ